MAQQGLFGRKQMPEQHEGEFLDVMRRSRALEERYSGLERRSQLIEQNMVESNRKLSSELRLLNEDVADIRKSVADLNEKLQLLAAELQSFSRKEDVEVIRKYLQYWEPLNFVTQSQVEKIVKELLKEKEEKE